MRKVVFSTDGVYHIYNRGVEKRKIFLANSDYWRFMQILYEFNDVAIVTRPHRRSFMDCARRAAAGEVRRPLVSILSFVLMPNHFHLLLQQRTEGGVSEFMHRIGTGYTNYFNLRSKRTGRLFESTFKARAVDKDSYLQHLIRYIHLNPLSLEQKDWKVRGIVDQKRAKQYLSTYRWSSYLAYIKQGGSRFLLDHTCIREVIGDYGQSHEDFVFAWTNRDYALLNQSLAGA